MNHYVPNWRMENDDPKQFHDLPPASDQRKFIGPDNELIELLWDNGHVVMHSQTNCRALPNIAESKQNQKPESSFKWGGSLGKSSILNQEDEPTSWFQNSLDDSLDMEFFEIFNNILNADNFVTDKVNKVEKCVKGSFFENCNACPKNSSFCPQNSMMLPSKSQDSNTTRHSPSFGNDTVTNFSPHTKSGRSDTEPAIRSFGGVTMGSETVVRLEESSLVSTISSSICGSNQVQNQVEDSHCISDDRGRKDDSVLGSADNTRQATEFDSMFTSMSGGSGCSFGRTEQLTITNHGHKRKRREADGLEVHSEEPEYESVEANNHAQKSAPSRRSRAAEVHNLSERRRRDRINEKMRALQELIPHCNKSDKASMLDEAIEYLKSLQLQVQIMWMGSGIAPMMFPGVQQYMSHIGCEIGHPPLPSINNPVQFPRATHINHSVPSISSTNQPLPFPLGISPFNYSNQIKNIHLGQPFSQYLGFPQIQAPPQMRDFYTYGSQMMQQNQTALSVDSKYIHAVEAPFRNIQWPGRLVHELFKCEG